MTISLQNIIKQNAVFFLFFFFVFFFFFFFVFFFFKLKKKIENFQFNSFDIFLFVQNIDCGHKIERILTIYVFRSIDNLS